MIRTKGEQKAYLDGYEMCAECIEKYLSPEGKKQLECLLSAVRSAVNMEDENGWIPIEEREPEIHKYVMFTTKTTRREIGYRAKEEPYYYLFGDSGTYVKSDHILAWMELPKPYKEEK